MLREDNRVVLIDDPYYKASEDEMQFRMTYEGKLLSNGHHTHRHEIRKHFHRQLKHLWAVTPTLAEMRDPPVQLVEINRDLRSPEKVKTRIQGLAERFERNGYQFVPLITDDLHVSFCGIELLYLRNGPRGAVVNKYGDIDNRIKTLLDALRMPEGKNELGDYTVPGENERPFFCLLQDDSMITKLAVETDVLLEPIGDRVDPNDARLIVTVSIQPRIVRLDLEFGTVNFVG